LRLDEAGALLPYVNTTSQWVYRCAKRIELDPELDPLAAMTSSPTWRRARAGA